MVDSVWLWNLRQAVWPVRAPKVWSYANSRIYIIVYS